MSDAKRADDLQRTTWRLNDQVIDAMRELRRLKTNHAAVRVTYNPTSRGSLLNAYREGDISFDECVAMIATATQN